MTDTFDRSITLRRAESLTAIVQKELERMIVSGELRPGKRINEQELASRFGVSRGPIREAMRGLEFANLVSTRINQGFFVREPTPKEIGEVYNVRAVVYGYLCGILASTICDDQLLQLMNFIDKMDTAIIQNNPEEYYRLNLMFHDATLECANNDCASRTYRTLINETQLTRKIALTSPTRMKESNNEHRELLEAIKLGDAPLARQLGEGHVLAGRQRWEATKNSLVEEDVSAKPMPEHGN